MNKLRRIWIGILVAMIGLAPAIHGAPKLSFGVQGSFTLTNHWSTEEKGGGFAVTSSIKNGFAGGVLAIVKLSRVFSLEGDFLLVQKGSDQTISVPGFPYGDIKVTYKLNYAEIPLLLRTHPFPAAKIQLSSAVGPYVSFLKSKKYSYRISVLGTEEKDIERLRSTDYGVIFGSALSIPANIVTLRIDYRYSMGFVDLTLPTGPGFPKVKLRNYCHYVMFGLIF